METSSHSLPNAEGATVYLVLLTNENTGKQYWHIRIVHPKTNQDIWSQQGFATKEEAQREFDKFCADLGITNHKFN